MQQTLSQVVISLLTVVGVLVMMFIISPLLAVIALVTIPLTIVITVLVARRSQKLFVAQWKATGILNARVEETFSGHSIVKTSATSTRSRRTSAMRTPRCTGRASARSSSPARSCRR